MKKKERRESEYSIYDLYEDVCEKLDRIEQELPNLTYPLVRIETRLDRMEKLQSKMRDNIFTIRKRTDDTEKLLVEHVKKQD